ncbi:N-6 DNA methylase [Seonamhaeicola marinus]|uniref:site-specific DNA-methyltransferase (adenine-specific) n=1 Tax=Seonamhaeicola marinus TaxID=1912246 RepID=A0A5D0J1N4_9FLAO|nr:N-6 DNA methylase [Seonamhaeicola marinus]
MNKEISKFLNELSDNLSIVNKLIIGAYLQFNNIKIKNNKLILSCIQGNDKQTVDTFINLIKLKNGKFDFEDVIHLFETSIPTHDISVNGAVYTPDYIKDYIVKETLNKIRNFDLPDLKVADIACGTGAFLYTVAQEIKIKSNKSYFEIFKENIYGLDISDYTITRAKILLSLLALSNGEDKEEFEFNLMVGNALNYNWNKKIKEFKGFDIVVGNPPYVRAKNLSEETKSLLTNWEVTKTGNPDLYIPFFEIGLKYLKPSGILGYITVNTFKRSVNARNLREYFKTNLFDLKIIDFGSSQIFANKSTYTCIVFIEKQKSNEVKYQKITAKDFLNKNLKDFTRINYNLLNTKKGWILNKPDVLENINKIESIGIPLGDKYPIRNGLATLSNDIFIFKPVDEDENYYYHQNGKLHKIEKGICRDVIKPNRLKTELEIPVLKEQIIFPYYQDNFQANNFDYKPNKKIVFEENYFKENFPEAYKYLKENKVQLLNRDKGKKTKYKWYEFGRTQALNDSGKKLLFPYMAGQPYFVYTDQEDLLLYAGYAVYFDSERELKVLKRILESKVFWYYIKKTSKPYSGNYFALAKNYVKDFGVCNLNENEKTFLLNTESDEERNEFLLEKYKINRKTLAE